MAANVQDVIMLVGDSLTQLGWEQGGFAQLLAESYNRKLDVINRGLSGYQTDWAIPIFEQIFAKQHEQHHVPQVKLLTIWYGANDAAPAPSPQHVPRDRYKTNLSHLIQMVKSPTSAYYSPETRIILITPPPVNSKQWNIFIPDSPRVFETTRSYAAAVKEVGEKENVPVADIWTQMFDGAGRTEEGCSIYLSDGLHLNSAGQNIVFKAIMDIVEHVYPELDPTNEAHARMQTVFVPWDQVDVQNPRPSLVKRKAQLES
ncbi:SGNH hydrolase-type esterase domain-containing protein [Suillus clintonianus]|uniref:SGNH hydrolase-type esterase domain-containing protein n=1 Tax=Suillus clintonianus TaxID=1904413 RepID=UPI001B85B9EE|nr:SGNH hydrolase-type esterase domain-containing protein [Suillus clintonianus]KAG2157409.1 SGNH hydrolase-type esterase domain-containing protein [Suillus clintonianus]